MSLATNERDEAFVAYCLSFGGATFYAPFPKMAGGTLNTDPSIVAAAIALGARDRAAGDPPMPRYAVAACVEENLADAPSAPPPAADHDPTQAALEAYAEGRADERAALEAWVPGAIGPAETISAGDMRAWLASRRASAPKRGMTAADVPGRVVAWYEGKGDDDSGNVGSLCDKIHRELEGAAR